MARPGSVVGGDVGFSSLPCIPGMFWKVFTSVLLDGIVVVDFSK